MINYHLLSNVNSRFNIGQYNIDNVQPSFDTTNVKMKDKRAISPQSIDFVHVPHGID